MQARVHESRHMTYLYLHIYHGFEILYKRSRTLRETTARTNGFERPGTKYPVDQPWQRLEQVSEGLRFERNARRFQPVLKLRGLLFIQIDELFIFYGIH